MHRTIWLDENQHENAIECFYENKNFDSFLQKSLPLTQKKTWTRNLFVTFDELWNKIVLSRQNSILMFVMTTKIECYQQNLFAMDVCERMKCHRCCLLRKTHDMLNKKELKKIINFTFNNSCSVFNCSYHQK